MGTLKPLLLIYSKNEFQKAPVSFDLQAAPVEIAVYQENLCICVQEELRVTFTRLSESPVSTRIRQSRPIRNIISGTDFFLHNDDENRIFSWQILPGQNSNHIYEEN